MDFDAKFAYDVLLPLSSCAYAIPLTIGSLPQNYDQIAPILPDGDKIAKESRFRKLIRYDQYGWIYLNRDTKVAVVTFRGTDDFVDVIKDATIESAPYRCIADYGEVHAGFQEVYFAIRDSVIVTLEQLRNSYDRLVLTGHSLGAAMSELAAPDIYYQHLGIPEVINFAAPRVGKANFISNFNRDIPNCVRIVNRWDKVPHLPLSITGYRHPKDSVTINGGFTLNALRAHGIDTSYRIGMNKLQNSG